jgi:hypothetical protein
MGAAARCVDVAIGSPIGQENNGQIVAEPQAAKLSLVAPHVRPVSGGAL